MGSGRQRYKGRSQAFVESPLPFWPRRRVRGSLSPPRSVSGSQEPSFTPLSRVEGTALDQRERLLGLARLNRDIQVSLSEFSFHPLIKLYFASIHLSQSECQRREPGSDKQWSTSPACRDEISYSSTAPARISSCMPAQPGDFCLPCQIAGTKDGP